MTDQPRDFAKQKEDTLRRLIANGYVSSPEVMRAYRTVPRELFIPQSLRDKAYADHPLPIGERQTISAIHMCLIYLEYLKLEKGLKVLEIGAGSGYHAALCAEIVSPTGEPQSGHVYTIERKPKLVEFAKENLDSAGYSDRVTVVLADGTLGFSDGAPYDRIMVAAAGPKTPPALIEQLAKGGLLIIPVGRRNYYQRLKLIEKDQEGKTHTQELMGVAFVPLIGEEGWPL